VLGFLEKLTLTPGEVGPDDVQPLHAADVSEQAIIDAIYICAFFNIIDRLADALNFHMPSSEMFSYRASLTSNHGYRFSSMSRPSK
jgi:hypothetical protein